MRLKSKLVLIEWEDSSYGAGWTSGELNEPSPCLSIGWIIKKTSTYIMVASHISCEKDPQRCGVMTIPLVAIKKMRTLKGIPIPTIVPFI